mmetsp:Transcript_18238/g.53148  ORF Transcript_18238/g.53148 Transcript_18238/m.53148 type:complete len:93 (-) Transcript_18238:926-1204(-)
MLAGDVAYFLAGSAVKPNDLVFSTSHKFGLEPHFVRTAYAFGLDAKTVSYIIHTSNLKIPSAIAKAIRVSRRRHESHSGTDPCPHLRRRFPE